MTRLCNMTGLLWMLRGLAIAALIIAPAAHADFPAPDDDRSPMDPAFGAASSVLIPDMAPGEAIASDKHAASDPAKPESNPAVSGDETTPDPDQPAQDAPTADKPTDGKAAPLSAVGEPLAPGMIEIMQQEIASGLRNRGVADRFNRFQSFAIGKLNSSSGRVTGSELAGNCRLSWYDHLMRNMQAAPAEAEEFTRSLHKAMLGNHEGLVRALAIIADKMDLPRREPGSFKKVATPQQALETVKAALTDVQTTFAAAFSTLTKSELRELQSQLYPVMVSQNQVGHTLQSRGTGRRLCDIMEKIDRDALHATADLLVPLTDPDLLEQLKGLPDTGDIRVEGVSGSVVARIDSPAGTILIGGKGPNTYQLDKLPNVACVIDLGGDDIYYEGSVSLDRPVLLLIDLDGNDQYRGAKPGIQGAAILGVSMLLDLAGDDTYQAQDVAQGSALAGVGMLLDFAGSDRYVGLRRVQGQALCGLGLLLDRSGDDDYRAAMWAQGFGAPLGFGLLDDLEGKDHYFCGGMWPDSYEETPGLEGWGQGVGAGLRQVANGGIGVILDGGGDDVYEFDYLSHGGGYWCAVGFARDFGGDDQRLITRNSYSGGRRTEPTFQRFGCGWGCHYSAGFCFDDQGDDLYQGTIMGTGMGWDCSMGALCDFGGNDRYESNGGLTQGIGHQASFGILYDYDGTDVYRGNGQGYAPGDIKYHDLPGCGGNFSFLIDFGGDDKYSCGARNNSYIQRGAEGGFLIDRPRQEEAEQTASQAARPTANQTATRNRAGK